MPNLWPDLLLTWLRAIATRRTVLVFTAGVASGLACWWLFGPAPAVFAVVAVWLVCYVHWLVRR